MRRTEFLKGFLQAAGAVLVGGRTLPAAGRTGQPERGTRATKWQLACAHDGSGTVVAGNLETAARAVARGADLLGYTAPSHHEFDESIPFYQTYWNAAGGFAGFWSGPTTDLLGSDNSDLGSESFYAYSPVGASRIYWGGRRQGERVMPQKHYDLYRWYVRDCWDLLYEHDEQGRALNGSPERLRAAIRDGLGLKIGIKNLFGLDDTDSKGPEHWVFLPGILHLNYLGSSRPITFTTRRLVVVSATWPLVLTQKSFHPATILARNTGEVGLELGTLLPPGFQIRRIRRPMRWLAATV